MKQLSILSLALLLVWSISCNSCTDSEKTEDIKDIFKEFQLYTSTGKIGDDKFGFIFKPFAEFISPKQANEFFNYRDIIHKNYNKLSFGGPIGSTTIKELIEVCSTNADGGIIFNLKKSDTTLQMQIVGIKKYVSKIDTDIKIDPTNTSNFRNYVTQARIDKKTPYLSFTDSSYIYFDKAKTLSLLSLMHKLYKDTEKIYFYYGYSKGEESNIYHPSLLFSIYPDLESKPIDSKDQTKYAFANRGTICCPPPPQF